MNLMYPRSELDTRIRRLKRWMGRRQVDISLIESWSNMLYLSGTAEASLLVVPLDGEPMLIARYAFGDEIAKERSPFHVEVIKPFYGISSKEISNPKAFDVVAEKFGKARRIAVDFLPSQDMIKELRRRFKRGRKSAAILDASKQLERMRIIKSDYEISLMKESASVAIEAFNSLEIKLGMTEREIANMLEFKMRELGADGPSFPTIVASGPNSFNAHHINTDRRVTEGDILLIDFGARYMGYCSDMTRTFFMGRPPDKFLSRYDAVLNAQLKALDYIRDGVPFEKPDIEARKVLKKAGLLEYYVHSLGHGVGIDIHEFLRLLVGKGGRLVRGMVVTDEPGIYIRGWGGIRIEDTVLVGKNHAIPLTESLDKDPDYFRR